MSRSIFVPTGLVAAVTLLALFCTGRHRARIEADIAEGQLATPFQEASN